jgi:hypothetical protein
MIDEQIENWIRKMQTACNRSALDSDINIIKLIQHIEDLYEQGRADEREACAKVCEEVGDKAKDNDGYTIGGYACAKAIRARSEPNPGFKNYMGDNWAGIV